MKDWWLPLAVLVFVVGAVVVFTTPKPACDCCDGCDCLECGSE